MKKKIEKVEALKPRIVKPRKAESEKVKYTVIPEITIEEKPKIREKVEFKVTPEIKIEVLTKIPVPDGHFRCIVCKAHEGINDFHQVDDIIDLPERRYKSLSFRGVVKKYEGERQPNKRR